MKWLKLFTKSLVQLVVQLFFIILLATIFILALKISIYLSLTFFVLILFGSFVLENYVKEKKYGGNE